MFLDGGWGWFWGWVWRFCWFDVMLGVCVLDLGVMEMLLAGICCLSRHQDMLSRPCGNEISILADNKDSYLETSDL